MIYKNTKLSVFETEWRLCLGAVIFSTMIRRVGALEAILEALRSALMQRPGTHPAPVLVLLATLGLSLATLVPSALAAPPPPSAAAVKAVIDCRAITDSAERLACFDKSVAAMAQAESSGDLMTLDREQRRAVRKQAFGLTLPTLEIFNRGEKPEEANQITAKVAGASQNASGRWVITLDDGAVWLQTDDYTLNRDPKAGSAVVISKGVLGSFFIKVDGQEAIKARRVS